MVNKKQYFVVLTLTAIVAISITAFREQEPKQQPRQRNLKVLPKDISRDSLHHLMDSYNDALGIKCNYCHAPRADDATKLDFSSDAKPAKDEARYMMNMTNELNKKYFTDMKQDTSKPMSQMVTCITCHNGKELPAR
jgi:hypothetical protein